MITITQPESMKTKFGTAKISGRYYKITDNKKGHNGKLLHRLIVEDYYNICLLEGYDVHHIDGDKLNNNIENLQILSHSEHIHIHNTGENNPNYGKHHTEETRKKISNSHKGFKLSDETKAKIGNALRGKNNAMYGKKGKNHPRYGKKHSIETRRKMSKKWENRTVSKETGLKISQSKSTTGYYRVCKHKESTCKQGFIYVYHYVDEENNKKTLSSVDINKLEEKVKTKGLEWIKY